MSTNFSIKLPELVDHPNLSERYVVNRILEGYGNNHGSIVLIDNVTVTTVEATCCSTACIILMPDDAAARSEYLAGSLYVSDVRRGQFDITHLSSTTRRVVRYAWIG